MCRYECVPCARWEAGQEVAPPGARADSAVVAWGGCPAPVCASVRGPRGRPGRELGGREPLEGRARTSRKRAAMACSSPVSSRLSTNIQKKACGLPARGRAYCRRRWNWNRYHPAGGGLAVSGRGLRAWVSPPLTLLSPSQEQHLARAAEAHRSRPYSERPRFSKDRDRGPH